MKTLVVYNHPYEGSFCHAILEKVVEGALLKGEVDVIDLDNDKFVYGQFHFNNKNHTNLLKNLLRTKESALTYRIKVKDNKVLLQIIYNFEHNKDLCVTRNSYGVVGVDFNKGFISISETDKYGNLINTFNIDYQYSKGNQTTKDFQNIATKLKDYCLRTGKDLVIEKLDFTKKKDSLISKRGKNIMRCYPLLLILNLVLSSLLNVLKIEFSYIKLIQHGRVG